MNDYRLLDRRGLSPKKSLGQNFMVEESSLRRMVDAARIGPSDVVLEIGAGLGALTAHLAELARRVVAVEIDARYALELSYHFANTPHVEVVQSDILKANLVTILGGDADSYVAIGNLPYYITSAIIRTLLEGNHPPCLLVVTVQYEVAERIVALPPDMSLLAVSVQFYGQPEIVERLAPGVFYPRPGVESAIVRITPHEAGPPLPQSQRSDFFRVVRAGFSQPRKKLRNSLAAGLHVSADAVVNWLAAVDIDPARRAETLTVGEWISLFRLRAKVDPDL